MHEFGAFKQRYLPFKFHDDGHWDVLEQRYKGSYTWSWCPDSSGFLFLTAVSQCVSWKSPAPEPKGSGRNSNLKK